MGCCQSNQTPLGKNTQLPFEPPQGEYLGEVGKEGSPFDLGTETKRVLEELKKLLEEEKGKVSEAEIKANQYKQYLGEPPKFGLEWPIHIQEFSRQKRPELTREIAQLKSISHETTFENERNQLKTRFQQEIDKQEALEKSLSELNDNRRKRHVEAVVEELKESNEAVQRDMEEWEKVLEELEEVRGEIPGILRKLEEVMEVEGKGVVTYTLDEEVTESVADQVVEQAVASALPPDESFSEIFDQASEDKDRLHTNALRKLYQRQREDVTECLPPQQVYSLCEEIIAAKAISDTESTYVSQSLDLFTVQYFLSRNPDAPVRTIVKFMNGIRKMKEDEEPFMQFYTALFGVFTEKPMPKAVVSLLPRISHYLTLFRQQGSDQRALEGPEPAVSLPFSDLVHITDVAELSYRLFEAGYQEYIGVLLEKICPDEVELVDYLHFILIHRMKSRNLDGISLFKYMTSTSSTLNFDDFSHGILTILQLNLSENAISTLFFAMKNKDRETVHRVDFIKFLRLWGYHRAVFGRKMMVCRCRVMSGLAEIYEEIREKVVMEVRKAFWRYQDEAEILPRIHLDSFLQGLNETRDYSKLISSLKKDKEQFTFQEIVTLLEKFQTEPYASRFYGKNEESRLEEEEIPKEIVKMLAKR